jgi:hypothetical protein
MDSRPFSSPWPSRVLPHRGGPVHGLPWLRPVEKENSIPGMLEQTRPRARGGTAEARTRAAPPRPIDRWPKALRSRSYGLWAKAANCHGVNRLCQLGSEHVRLTSLPSAAAGDRISIGTADNTTRKTTRYGCGRLIRNGLGPRHRLSHLKQGNTVRRTGLVDPSVAGDTGLA